MKMRRSNAIQRLAHAIKPSAASKAVNSKRIMVDFAARHGLVYFGYVNQRTDEHKLVRGMTSSPNHRDNHYCIGSVDGYDVVAVERRTEITHPGKQPHSTTWTILAVDLNSQEDMPHIFFDSGPRNETFYANLFTKFSKLKQTDLSTLSMQGPEFSDNYRVFAPSDRALDAERLFTPDVTESLGKHFSPLDIEVEGDMFYLYADNLPLTPELLDAMLKNGLWLAERLDAANTL